MIVHCYSLTEVAPERDGWLGRLALILGLVLSVSASLTFAITLIDPPGTVQVLLPGLAGLTARAPAARSPAGRRASPE